MVNELLLLKFLLCVSYVGIYDYSRWGIFFQASHEDGGRRILSSECDCSRVWFPVEFLVINWHDFGTYFVFTCFLVQAIIKEKYGKVATNVGQYCS